MLRRLLLLSLLVTMAGTGSSSHGIEPRLIVYYETGLLPWSDDNAAAKVMKEAAACGYSEMVVADGVLQGWEPIAADVAANLTRWQSYAESLNMSLIPLIFPFSVPEYTIYASTPLGAELAEPLFSTGAPFVVSPDGRRLTHQPTSYLTNGDLAIFNTRANTFAGWTLQQPGKRTFVDTRTAPVGGSGTSLRIGPGYGPAMAMQPLTHAPARRQLRISYWAKSERLDTVQYNVEVCQLDRSQPFGLGRRISWHSMFINATQDWTLYEFVASSWNGGTALFVGVQPDQANPLLQPMNGSLWFANFTVQDTAVRTVSNRSTSTSAVLVL